MDMNSPHNAHKPCFVVADDSPKPPLSVVTPERRVVDQANPKSRPVINTGDLISHNAKITYIATNPGVQGLVLSALYLNISL